MRRSGAFISATRKQPRQISCTHHVEVADHVDERVALIGRHTIPGEVFELVQDLLPRERWCIESRVGRDFPCQRATISQCDCDACRHLVWKSVRVRRIGPDRNPAEQSLDIVGANAFRSEPRRQHLLVQDCNSDQIRETVIGVFLRADDALVALFAAADDLVGDVEDLNLDYDRRLPPKTDTAVSIPALHRLRSVHESRRCAG